jgi:hypothetical protein
MKPDPLSLAPSTPVLDSLPICCCRPTYAGIVAAQSTQTFNI